VRQPAEDPESEQGFVSVVVGDGRPLLFALAGALVFAGGFAIFLAVTGQLLPHDTAYLGMTADELCRIESCRIVDFMVHDRVAFGGTLVGVGVLYTWILAFPLGRGETWAWWTLAVSGIVGFLTFLSYLGYGYLDTWHGIGTLLMLPVFALGMYRSKLLVGAGGPAALIEPGEWFHRRDRTALGRLVLLVGAVATIGGGLAILRVGIGETFVPEDLEFMGLDAAALDEINPRLIPLLAHDRAGFGGGVLTMGITTALSLWCSGRRRHLLQAVAIAGGVSLTAALAVHGAVGYTDPLHLAPAVLAAACLILGLALEYPGSATAAAESSRRRSRSDR